jgi:short-subunit dehydrogenase
MRKDGKGTQTVIVTGASAGVGRAAALRFAAEGARVGLIARDESALEAVRRDITGISGEAAVAAADVADADALFAADDALESRLGPVDVWVNNAMVTVFSRFSDITPEEFRRVTEVTYLGAVNGTMAALRSMRPRNRGTIVQVGSALAYRGIPLQAAYCGAKHAIRGFTESLRSELIHDRRDIHLTMVNLPAINTPQFDWARTHMGSRPRPVAPVFQPDVAARAIVRAAHERKREYWLGLSTAKAILGNMIGPGWLDRYLAHMAFEGQSTGEPVAPDRPDNLDRPVPALHRTQGSFGDEAAAHAVDLPGPASRVGAVAAGALVSGVLGAVIGRALRR